MLPYAARLQAIDNAIAAFANAELILQSTVSGGRHVGAD